MRSRSDWNRPRTQHGTIEGQHHDVARRLRRRPNQSVENPLGEGGQALHEWAFAVKSFRTAHGMERGSTGPDEAVAAESLQNIGATIMGRNMFGGGPGPWGDDPWNG